MKMLQSLLSASSHSFFNPSPPRPPPQYLRDGRNGAGRQATVRRAELISLADRHTDVRCFSSSSSSSSKPDASRQAGGQQQGMQTEAQAGQ